METLYTGSKKQDQELAGSDHELLITKFRLKLKKIGKTTRSFKYDLNQILYDYTVELTNRFKGCDLIDCLKNYGWRFVNTVQEAVIKTSPKNKKCKNAKWLSEEALQTAEKGRETKGKGEKERYTHLNTEFQRIARRDEKAFLSEQCKETEEKNRMGKTRDLFKKIRDTKGTSFLQFCLLTTPPQSYPILHPLACLLFFWLLSLLLHSCKLPLPMLSSALFSKRADDFQGAIIQVLAFLRLFPEGLSFVPDLWSTFLLSSWNFPGISTTLLPKGNSCVSAQISLSVPSALLRWQHQTSSHLGLTLGFNFWPLLLRWLSLQVAPWLQSYWSSTSTVL